MISVWAKAVNYATLLQTPPCSFFFTFLSDLFAFFGVFKGSFWAQTKGYVVFFSAPLSLFARNRGAKKQKTNKKLPSTSASCAASWSAWIYASRLDIPVTASTPPPPYGGDGPTDDYSGVRLTHKNAIWQKPASFTDEAPPPDAQWLMTAFLKVGWGVRGCADPLWGAVMSGEEQNNMRRGLLLFICAT